MFIPLSEGLSGILFVLHCLFSSFSRQVKAQAIRGEENVGLALRLPTVVESFAKLLLIGFVMQRQLTQLKRGLKDNSCTPLAKSQLLLRVLICNTFLLIGHFPRFLPFPRGKKPRGPSLQTDPSD